MKAPRILTSLAILLAAAFGANAQEAAQPQVKIVPVPPHPPERPPVVVVPEEISIWLWTDRNTYWEGDDVDINFRVSRDSYLYLFSTDPSGVTRMIFPSRFDRDNHLDAGRTYSIPDRDYRLVATGPSGFETLHAVATTSRFDWINRDYEPINYSETFPVVKQSPKEFYADVQRSAQVEVEKESSARDAAPQSGGLVYEPHPGPGAKIIVQPPRQPDRGHGWILPGYGEAIHTVRVRGHYGDRPSWPQPRPEYPSYPDRPDRAVEAAEIKVSSSPSRARVYIDGVYYGHTPLEVKLQPGKYDVMVQKDHYLPWMRRVNLEPGRREAFSFALKRD